MFPTTTPLEPCLDATAAAQCDNLYAVLRAGFPADLSQTAIWT